MESHFVWWNTEHRPLDVHRLTEDVIATSLHYSPKRRERFLHARVALAELMAILYGHSKLPRTAIDCRGRPFFIDPSLPDFSLAYGGNIVGVMLGCTGKVGLDIEVIRARQGGFVPLQQQYLSNTEKVWIARQEDRLEAITQLWAIRQSVLKISGLGNSGLDTLRIQPGAGKLRSSATPQVETLSAIHNDIAWACSRSPSLQRLHYWYMQPNGRLANVDREKRQALELLPTFLRFTSHVPLQTVSS
ncbi:4'-phosphopantetheinyl transferase superfamily protein [Edwardsiella piscicida]|uniref:4'-phosphopantetheinyl transferase domain-containing protein n=3 Tax=Edwardsiella TaxID=635 RepID=A0A0H3DXB2_EDWTF|nr:4'-phosphopantetheinyl transferase superfamily protein [Edwardsiella piscicida]ACY86378.1 hypothetical protein ETAE_3547 [Edwardsiella tarda EIB202]ADM43310.1 hypothetical protein ETAF_3207 [Edwardsiella tarda FL6-60]AOP44680.1 4'-phosphopantetheinyl transferase superfamily protein [Edwardsiella piscicida]ARD18282.1 hypothetical protein BXA22_07990 [Edwardsiella piscicida]EKS7767572.1 4'-phosphopantetheinyl transferase superfamily protein [Edwardsiella piscicida]